MKKKLFFYIEEKDGSPNKRCAKSHILKGVGVDITYIEKLQGEKELMFIKRNNVDFFIRFHKQQESFTIKFTDSCNIDNVSQLVNYAILMMKNFDYEEVYNTFLILTKIYFKTSIYQFTEEYKNYKKRPYLNTPFSKNVQNYLNQNETIKKILSTMKDISIDRLTYFEQFLKSQ
jgi:hypothetical protein